MERYFEYPVKALGWSDDESSVSLADGAAQLPGRILMGGISERQVDPVGPAERVRLLELHRSLPGRLLVAPGCSLPDDVSSETLLTLRQLVRSERAR